TSLIRGQFRCGVPWPWSFGAAAGLMTGVLGYAHRGDRRSSYSRFVEEPAEDATRRTHLANERTYLAWWRTGLTALASGVGVGRVVPSLTHQTRWPYAILGAGFALLGIVAIAYGFVRQQAVRDAVRGGGFDYPRETVLVALTVSGV